MVPTSLEHSWFARHFDFHLPALTNFVGGGGKTSLILALLEEYAEIYPVLYTTTTRIHPPPLTDGLAILTSDHPSLLKLMVNRIGERLHDRKCRLVATQPAIIPGLLHGVSPDFAESIDREHFPIILNEADGARSMSIKMPREGEPVLMTGMNYLVPVLGIDCLNKPLGPQTLFRWEIATERLSLKAGEPLTPELAAEILLHKDGVCRNWRPGTKIIPYINKVDSSSGDMLALKIARALLQNRNFPVERVVWGSLHNKRGDSLSVRLG